MARPLIEEGDGAPSLPPLVDAACPICGRRASRTCGCASSFRWSSWCWPSVGDERSSPLSERHGSIDSLDHKPTIADRRGGAQPDRGLHRRAHPDAGTRAAARRHFRQGAVSRHARGRRFDLRPCPHALAALPSRAQDRRTVARHRARHQGHRHAAVLRAVQHLSRPCSSSAFVQRHPAREAFNVVVRARHAGHGRRLCLVHLRHHALAHPVPPRHEPERPGRQHQGGRQPAQLRDGQVFQQRGARDAPLRQVDGEIFAAPRSRRRLRCRC